MPRPYPCHSHALHWSITPLPMPPHITCAHWSLTPLLMPPHITCAHVRHGRLFTGQKQTVATSATDAAARDIEPLVASLKEVLNTPEKRPIFETVGLLLPGTSCGSAPAILSATFSWPSILAPHVHGSLRSGVSWYSILAPHVCTCCMARVAASRKVLHTCARAVWSRQFTCHALVYDWLLCARLAVCAACIC